jgi:hypothetical protein
MGRRTGAAPQGEASPEDFRYQTMGRRSATLGDGSRPFTGYMADASSAGTARSVTHLKYIYANIGAVLRSTR